MPESVQWCGTTKILALRLARAATTAPAIPPVRISAIAEFFRFSEYIRMSVAELPIEIDREQVARFCHDRDIRKLSLFGSVLHHDFDPQRSDVDVLAEFGSGVLKRVGFQYFGYGEELTAIIARKVDFCSRLHPLIGS
jgi:predicted nucleotidyltransferase